MKKYDLVVLGGGAGGLTVAAGAASLGATVALIEKNKYLGGDCLHYGCIPSKALIQSAKRVYEARKAAEEFGFKIEGQPSLAEAKKRVKAAIAHIQHHDSDERFEKLGVDLYHGKGYFEDPHRVKIEDGETIEGKRIVMATGSRPNIPAIEGIEGIAYLTNEAIFELEEVPKRLLVLGAGPIGMEMAQSLARFGSEVTVIQRSATVLAREDQEILPIIQQALEKELTFRLNTQVKRFERVNDEKIAVIEQNGQEEKLAFDEILISTGRKANIDDLGLENMGVQVEKGYIVVNEYLQTSVPHIFAVGDINGKFLFTHAAGMEGKLVVRNAVLGLKAKVSYENVPWVTYTDPEVYHLGLTEQQAREQYGEDLEVFKVDVNEVDRFVADRDNLGFLKVITTRKGKILGAHAVGKNAGDWMQEIVFAKTMGHKIGGISNVIHPYPTHGAIVQQAADQYWRKKLFEGWIPEVTKKYIRLFR